MLRMKHVSRVACFTLVRLSPSGVFRICTVPFELLFFHHIYFYDVVPIDFVLQPSFQHVEDSRLQALFQVLPAVLLKSKTVNTTKKTREVSIRGESGLRSLNKLLYFPLLVCMFLCFSS